MSEPSVAGGFASAAHSNEHAVNEANDQEIRRQRARDLADCLARGDNPDDMMDTTPDSWGTTLSDEPRSAALSNEVEAESVAAQYLPAAGLACSAHSQGTETGESAAAAQARRRATGIERQCVACQEWRITGMARAACHHEYCRDCLDELFRLATDDETLFPPRCCGQPIPFQTVRLFIHRETSQRFSEKKTELETPNRTYCHEPTCSTFIPAENVRETAAMCGKCGRWTCVSCKAQGHTGDCPSDGAMQQLLAAAATAGWQRCYNCWRLVELKAGCHHIT